MSKAKVIALFYLVAISGVLVSQFQNCAPSKNLTNVNSEETDSFVGVIEDLGGEKLKFFEKSIVLHDSVDSVSIIGGCSRSAVNHSVDWRINSQGGDSAVDAGESDCDGGGFQIIIENVVGMDCDENYQLFATSSNGGEDVVNVTRKCAPLASKIVNAQVNEEVQCYMELENEQTSSGNSCFYSCYLEDKLYSRDVVAEDQCAFLSAQSE